MQVNWMKCQGEVWCKLNSVNLEHKHFINMYGVYIIWHGGSASKVVYVGQGYIKDRLAEHRKNQEIQSFEQLGLYVTWASVPSEYRDGVEVYLANTWSPKVGVSYPRVAPIEVNSPW